MKTIFKIDELTIILLVSFITRLIIAYFYSQETIGNEWNTLLHNYETTGTVGLFISLSEFSAIDKLAESGEKVLPSAFMPPLYFYFIYVIKFLFSNILNFVDVIIFFQIILSLVSIYFFFKILNFLGTTKILILPFVSIFAFFPIYVYSAIRISSITIQIFLFLGFIYFLIRLNQKNDTKFLIYFSIFSGLLILTRGEFYLFYLLTIFYFFLFFKKKIKNLFVSLIISLLIISPYIYRNYLNFDAIVLTKSVGFNLLKGNNPSFIVEGNSDFIINNFSSENIKINTDNNYEIKLDDFYRDQAINYIKNNPNDYLKFYFKKVFSFIFFDLNSSYDNYYNPLHIFPKILLSILGLTGAILCLRKKGFFQFISLYYFANIFLFSIFFILPRYSIILLPINLLLIIEMINFFRRKF
tara:strand:- start:1809 stop:3044 length:1236 start_codon:yes stop_codon:yes gene_type:complete